MDKFELYLLRNIFKIPPEVDIANPTRSLQNDMPMVTKQRQHEEVIDAEVLDLHRRIIEVIDRDNRFAIDSPLAQINKLSTT